MNHGTTKTLRVSGIFLVILLCCACALLPPPVQAQKVTATVTVESASGSNPWDVAVSPNGEYAYVANYGSDSVSVISTASNTLTATITVGSGPSGVAVTPDGAYVYVTNADGSVSVISAALKNSVATKTGFSVVDLSIVIIVIIIVLFLIILAWYRRRRKSIAGEVTE